MVQDRTGRTDTGLGMVSLLKYKDGKWIKMNGRELANARMKAETKAKRRATLSICGLGILDETELDTMEVRYLTPQGRIIEPGPEPPNPYLDKYLEREKEAVSKLTPAQREVLERKLPPPATAPSGAYAVPSLFYTYHPESETYRIDGVQEMKTANKDLLGPLWDRVTEAIVATPADLGRLISQFESRKVPFKELKRA